MTPPLTKITQLCPHSFSPIRATTTNGPLAAPAPPVRSFAYGASGQLPARHSRTVNAVSAAKPATTTCTCWPPCSPPLGLTDTRGPAGGGTELRGRAEDRGTRIDDGGRLLGRACAPAAATPEELLAEVDGCGRGPDDDRPADGVPAEPASPVGSAAAEEVGSSGVGVCLVSPEWLLHADSALRATTPASSTVRRRARVAVSRPPDPPTGHSLSRPSERGDSAAGRMPHTPRRGPARVS